MLSLGAIAFSSILELSAEVRGAVNEIKGIVDEPKHRSDDRRDQSFC
jgi:hypothetical protein